MIEEAKKQREQNLELAKTEHLELSIYEQRIWATVKAEEDVFGNLDELRK